MRRNIKSLVNSLSSLFELIVFFLIILIFFAVIGYRILGELESDKIDKFGSDFGDIGKTINSLYVLFTTDNYPDIMVPSVEESYWYLLYFVPFMLISLFIVAPIPVAILFNGYKRERA